VRLGADNKDVFCARLGLSAQELAELETAGVI
jgi:hypothetical protein